MGRAIIFKHLALITLNAQFICVPAFCRLAYRYRLKFELARPGVKCYRRSTQSIHFIYSSLITFQIIVECLHIKFVILKDLIHWIF